MPTKTIEQWKRSCLADKGDHESPLGSNNTKYGRRFGFNRVAWCVIYGYLKYLDAGVVWWIKTASCVAIYDEAVRRGFRIRPQKCVVGDSVIRTWQRLHRNSPGFDPEQTHFQEVVAVRRRLGRKQLGLWGGNQGAGYVGPTEEWVWAGDTSILGGIAFSRLFHPAAKHEPPKPEPKHDPAADGPLPAAKSHPASPKPTPPKKGTPRRPWWWRFLLWSRW